MRVSQSALLLGLVLAAGCFTDELVVFNKGLLSSDEMKPVLGQYDLTARKDFQGKDSPFDKGTLVLEKSGPRYQFSLKMVYQGDKKRDSYSGHFLLSRIPGSKSGLLLFSAPQITINEKKKNNFYGILKQEKGTLNFWVVTPDHSLVKEHLAFEHGVSRAAEVKSFLEKYADAFVLANAPILTFKKK
ncbi:MAG: hypothetical protein JW818_14015 [Pirellulales bacterium]|nr:hypothetical protein [Pirellulales bacterium]